MGASYNPNFYSKRLIVPKSIVNSFPIAVVINVLDSLLYFQLLSGSLRTGQFIRTYHLYILKKTINCFMYSLSFHLFRQFNSVKCIELSIKCFEHVGELFYFAADYCLIHKEEFKIC